MRHDPARRVPTPNHGNRQETEFPSRLHQEWQLDALRRAGLSEEEARAQLTRLAAGDVWGG